APYCNRGQQVSLVSVGGIVPHHTVVGRRKSPGVSGSKKCPMTGSSGRNSALSLVSVGGTVPHHWFQW
ncbi:unnamed protein product, partial [Staurois parvus]